MAYVLSIRRRFLLDNWTNQSFLLLSSCRTLKSHTVYYQIFEDGIAATAKNTVPGLSSSEPSIGRIRARDIAPPRTVGIIKRAISKSEEIPLLRIADLFLLAGASGDAAEDHVRLDILDEKIRGPGGTPEVPIAIVLGKDEVEVEGAVMSHDEPGKVASNVRPKGWKMGETKGNGACESLDNSGLVGHGLTVCVDLCLAMKPKGGLRWLDATIPPGKTIYVDPSGLCNHSDWTGNCASFVYLLSSLRLNSFIPCVDRSYVPRHRLRDAAVRM